jgi:hypothetical protein
VFVVERHGLRTSAAKEAVISLRDFRDETLETKIYYATLAVDH